MGSSQSSQKQVTRKTSFESISSNSKSPPGPSQEHLERQFWLQCFSTGSFGAEHNIVVSRGNAEARIIQSNGAAVAMAKSSKGAAYAYTDGKDTKFDVVGNGQITVGSGVAYASAGKNNKALAYSSRADKNSRIEGKKVKMITHYGNWWTLVRLDVGGTIWLKD